ncbi:hypothetical protein WR25_27041 [Diploscapter pachys]|uniref:Uncharacterized protein n=1 Tax=Diploscapter pachys TaxID=2018661 RepID=A0A2A2KCH0_9BILA|nr:hypothetical protein WR25_27041 [Diploscapter pachys]
MNCNCHLPCDCVPANLIADCLGASPAYHQEDTARWNSALQQYSEMHSQAAKEERGRKMQTRYNKSRSQHHSPEREWTGRFKRCSHEPHFGSLHDLARYGHTHDK